MADLMKGKRGLVMGVANDRSIAWGIASALASEGADLAFSYQGEAFGKRVQPLAASVGSDFLIDVDVTNEESLDACFAEIGRRWGALGGELWATFDARIGHIGPFTFRPAS